MPDVHVCRARFCLALPTPTVLRVVEHPPHWCCATIRTVWLAPRALKSRTAVNLSEQVPQDMDSRATTAEEVVCLVRSLAAPLPLGISAAVIETILPATTVMAATHPQVRASMLRIVVFIFVFFCQRDLRAVVLYYVEIQMPPWTSIVQNRPFFDSKLSKGQAGLPDTGTNELSLARAIASEGLRSKSAMFGIENKMNSKRPTRQHTSADDADSAGAAIGQVHRPCTHVIRVLRALSSTGVGSNALGPRAWPPHHLFHPPSA